MTTTNSVTLPEWESISRPDRTVGVVRVRTSYWCDYNGSYSKQSITYLRRQHPGPNALQEEAECTSPEHCFATITNLNECADGVYDVVVANCDRDWETNEVLSCEYNLVRRLCPGDLTIPGKYNRRRSTVGKLYDELLYQVSRVVPGQSRHQTALARIRDAERQSNNAPCTRVVGTDGS